MYRFGVSIHSAPFLTDFRIYSNQENNRSEFQEALFDESNRGGVESLPGLLHEKCPQGEKGGMIKGRVAGPEQQAAWIRVFSRVAEDAGALVGLPLLLEAEGGVVGAGQKGEDAQAQDSADDGCSLKTSCHSSPPEVLFLCLVPDEFLQPCSFFVKF